MLGLCALAVLIGAVAGLGIGSRLMEKHFQSTVQSHKG